MRDVAIQIAVMVGLQAQQDGVAQVVSEQDLRERVRQRFWIPQYFGYNFSEKISRISTDEFTILPKEVSLCQIHDLISTAIQHRFDHVKSKAPYLL